MDVFLQQLINLINSLPQVFLFLRPISRTWLSRSCHHTPSFLLRTCSILFLTPNFVFRLAKLGDFPPPPVPLLGVFRFFILFPPSLILIDDHLHTGSLYVYPTVQSIISFAGAWMSNVVFGWKE